MRLLARYLIIGNNAKNIINELTFMSIMDCMVQIGKNVKYDHYGRVTLPAKLAELLDLLKGEDEVTWHVIGGQVILKKDTILYNGHDFEGDEIRERLIKYEDKYYRDFDEEMELTEEERETRARAEYEKAKMARAELRKK